MPQHDFLQGRTVLIVQRRWIVARALADEFEAKGAQVLSATDARSALALSEHPDVSVAIIDSHSRDLCRRLEARRIPFLLYTGRTQVHDECTSAPIIHKPAAPAAIVTRVEELLS
jgi:DNA-binding response OmpR family regulator